MLQEKFIFREMLKINVQTGFDHIYKTDPDSISFQNQDLDPTKKSGSASLARSMQKSSKGSWFLLETKKAILGYKEEQKISFFPEGRIWIRIKPTGIRNPDQY